ncbi:hypothetical protein Q7P37_003035 [Cladosporium fusiforme]
MAETGASGTEQAQGQSISMDNTPLELDELHQIFTEVTAPVWLRSSPQSRKYIGRTARITRFLCKPSAARSLLRLFKLLLSAISSILVLNFVFFPSYNGPPSRYSDLERQVQEAQGTNTATGSANLEGERVFIAASLHDTAGQLLRGAWAEAILELIHLLGPDNVFLSIYENDADDESLRALYDFKARVPCSSALVHEQLDTSSLTHVVGADGVSKLKRIAFLSTVRNHALDPLEDFESPASRVSFDKLLFVNDVYFKPIDAANLLFSTNMDEKTGKTNYRAACGLDFINPVKFYDTYATRDLDGFEIGIPIYPWFTSAGRGLSRYDVTAQRDAVRVKSCWGGIVAFEARWFQQREQSVGHDRSKHGLLRFRAEGEVYWDASECCLIHADLSRLAAHESNDQDSGIFMNPYVRVAYSPQVLRWLPLIKRIERLFGLIHPLGNWIARLPRNNPKRLQPAADNVDDSIWVWEEDSFQALANGEISTLKGGYQQVRRNRTSGGFCGRAKLSYIEEHDVDGGRRWATELPPVIGEYD